MSAAVVLRRLHAAGVQVWYVAPDNIALRGPLTRDLVELARAAKAELLDLVRPRAEARPCACCGRFFFMEPATVCFWCRAPESIDENDKSRARYLADGFSVTSVNANPAASPKRACPSCGGGLSHDDGDEGPCWTCRRQIGSRP